MENVDKELLQMAVKSDIQIRRLYDQHRILDQKIENMLGRTYLSDSENREVKMLKKQKLIGKDMLMRLLDEFKLRDRTHARMN